jgi:phosphomannomutase
MIPLLLRLELLSREAKPLSSLVAPLREAYFTSGEINYDVPDPKAKIAEIEATFNSGERDYTDGLSVAFHAWRFNLRPSNTEPLLRLNVEARNQVALEQGLHQLGQFLGTPQAGH